MNPIALYLEKFRTLENEHLFIRDKIVQTVKEESGVTLSPKEVSITKTGIQLLVSGPKRVQILLKKAAVEEKLKKSIR